MLLELSQWLAKDYRAFSVFNYITLRAVLATLTALFIGLIFGPAVIRRLTEMKIGQAVRTDGPQTHLIKSGTPTMGGVLVLISVGLATLLWADLGNRFIWLVLLVTTGFGLIGWVDDYRKVVHRNPKGMSAREKYLWQSGIGLFAAFYLAFAIPSQTSGQALDLFVLWVKSGLRLELPSNANLIVPFFKEIAYPMGVFGFITLTYFVIVGTSNAVNLTDGADGLAIMPAVLVGSALGIFAYVTGNAVFSRYLLIPFIPGRGRTDRDMRCHCRAPAWRSSGTTPIPAQVFMGDVGALALGAALGTIAVIVRQEIVLFIMGGVFVAETISVMMQVAYFKYTKRKYGDGPPHLPDGAAASPLRSRRRQGIAGGGALLDRHDDAGPVRPFLLEAEVGDDRTARQACGGDRAGRVGPGDGPLGGLQGCPGDGARQSRRAAAPGRAAGAVPGRDAGEGRVLARRRRWRRPARLEPGPFAPDGRGSLALPGSLRCRPAGAGRDRFLRRRTGASRAGRLPAQGPGDHRHQRQDHGDAAGRTHGGRSGNGCADGRQHQPGRCWMRCAQRIEEDRLPQIWVLELSSFQLALAGRCDTSRLHCTASVVLNISQDHLDWHQSMAHYRESKLRIHLDSDCCIVNADDRETDPAWRGEQPPAPADRAADAPEAPAGKRPVRAAKVVKPAPGPVAQAAFSLSAPTSAPGLRPGARRRPQLAGRGAA